MSAPIRGIMIVEDCNFCRATGAVSKKRCGPCDGSGALQRPATRLEARAFLGLHEPAEAPAEELPRTGRGFDVPLTPASSPSVLIYLNGTANYVPVAKTDSVRAIEKRIAKVIRDFVDAQGRKGPARVIPITRARSRKRGSR